MTVNLSEKDYMQLLEATGGKPALVFTSNTDIFMEGALMAHKATCTTHADMRCDCHPELKYTNELLPPSIVLGLEFLAEPDWIE